MRQDIDTSKTIVISDLTRIFMLLASLLNGTAQLIIETHKLLISLMTHLLATEVEQNMPLLWPQLVLYL